MMPCGMVHNIPTCRPQKNRSPESDPKTNNKENSNGHSIYRVSSLQ
jgi:hypothetical protein